MLTYTSVVQTLIADCQTSRHFYQKVDQQLVESDTFVDNNQSSNVQPFTQFLSFQTSFTLCALQCFAFFELRLILLLRINNNNIHILLALTNFHHFQSKGRNN